MSDLIKGHFKHGSTERDLDNLFNKFNKQLSASAKTFGTDSKHYQSLAFKAFQAVGADNMKLNKNGVMQISRSNKFLRELSQKLKKGNGINEIEKMKKAKTVREEKKTVTNKIIKRVGSEEFNKLNHAQKDNVIARWSDVSRNNIAEIVAVYKGSEEGEIEEGEESPQMEETNGRETNALKASYIAENFIQIDSTGYGLYQEKSTGEVFTYDELKSELEIRINQQEY